MPTFLSQLRNVVWTALFALIAGCISVIAAISGASLEIVAGFGVYGLIMAILSPRT